MKFQELGTDHGQVEVTLSTGNGIVPCARPSSQLADRRPGCTQSVFQGCRARSGLSHHSCFHLPARSMNRSGPMIRSVIHARRLVACSLFALARFTGIDCMSHDMLIRGWTSLTSRLAHEEVNWEDKASGRATMPISSAAFLQGQCRSLSVGTTLFQNRLHERRLELSGTNFLTPTPGLELANASPQRTCSRLSIRVCGSVSRLS